MNNDQIKEKVLKWFPDAEIPAEAGQFLNVIVTPEILHPLAEKLRYDKETHFDYLFCLSGVDWVSNLMVVYHLTSTNLGHEIVLRLRLQTERTLKLTLYVTYGKPLSFTKGKSMISLESNSKIIPISEGFCLKMTGKDFL